MNAAASGAGAHSQLRARPCHVNRREAARLKIPQPHRWVQRLLPGAGQEAPLTSSSWSRTGVHRVAAEKISDSGAGSAGISLKTSRCLNFKRELQGPPGFE